MGYAWYLTDGAFSFVITILISTPFWTKKLKIALLTLATFAALC
jgi:hypothetical protein